jgi:acyl-CoA dehydrogenase
MAREQLLLAGSTTEGTTKGDTRRSSCHIEGYGDALSLRKQGAVISYGIFADGLLATARRSADAAESDQVLVALLKEDCRFKVVADWDALGMRGTRTETYDLEATLSQGQVLTGGFGFAYRQTMHPVAHLLWCSVWAGIAAEALDRARRHVRAASRLSDVRPMALSRLSGAARHVQMMRGALTSAIDVLETSYNEPDAMEAIQTRFALLKVTISELALAAVLEVTRLVGFEGYRNNSPVSFGRLLRDICSAPLMINNDRIIESSAGGLVLSDFAPNLCSS